MSPERMIFTPDIEFDLPAERIIPGTQLYMAGGKGFSEAGRSFHNTVLRTVEKMGGKTINPWTLTMPGLFTYVERMPISEQRVEAWSDLDRVIAKNNYQGILRADGLIADLDGTDVDSGTSSEIGAAFVLGIPIIGYRGDFRSAGDNEGVSVNLQVEFFVRESGGGRGTIIDKIEDLPHELLRLWGEK